MGSNCRNSSFRLLAIFAKMTISRIFIIANKSANLARRISIEKCKFSQMSAFSSIEFLRPCKLSDLYTKPLKSVRPKILNEDLNEWDLRHS